MMKSIDRDSSSKDLVTISYSELIAGTASSNSSSLLERIEKAFGKNNSLGILGVTGVPSYAALRQRLLTLSHSLGNLPSEELENLSRPEASYCIGWSRGKEILEEGKYDTKKGSYYANPLHNDALSVILKRDFHESPSSGKENNDSNEEQRKKEKFLAIANQNPAFYGENIWPSSSLPDLEPAFMEMGKLIIDTGILVARLCDDYTATQCDEYTPNYLETTIKNSNICKGRLLHYFPSNNNEEESQQHVSIAEEGESKESDFSSWCGWHNDHGSLTGLVSGAFFDKDGNIIDCPDPEAGLYIKSRCGDLIHVKIPHDTLAFQIGETSQIHTGGVLQATPHAVRGCNNNSKNSTSLGISRQSFAVFMEPEFFGSMDIQTKGRTIEMAQNLEAENYLPNTVKTLRSRWKQGMSFGEFSEATFASFH